MWYLFIDNIDSGFGTMQILEIHASSIASDSQSQSLPPSVHYFVITIDVKFMIKRSTYASINSLGIGASRHDKIVSKLKENMINMFDLPNGLRSDTVNKVVVNDITKDWLSAPRKMFAMTNSSNIIILFDKNLDINIESNDKLRFKLSTNRCIWCIVCVCILNPNTTIMTRKFH